MEKLLDLDEKNYDPNLEEILRISIRGIFYVAGKLALIESSYGEVKLPGGGMEKGETELETLIREVKEETGYIVKPESVIPFGEIEEKRLSTHEPMIWHQINRIYFCDVYNTHGECEFSENEKKYKFHLVFYTLEEAIEKNLAMLKREGELPWNCREYNTLILLRDYYIKHPN